MLRENNPHYLRDWFKMTIHAVLREVENDLLEADFGGGEVGVVERKDFYKAEIVANAQNWLCWLRDFSYWCCWCY